MTDGIDKRQLMIIYQNALSHATQLAMHNAKNEKIDVEVVLDLARRIAHEVVLLGSKLD